MKLSASCVRCKESHQKWWLQEIVDGWGDKGPPASAVAQGGVFCFVCTLGEAERRVEDERTPADVRQNLKLVLGRFTSIKGAEYLGIRR